MASIDRVESRIKELKMKDKAAIIAGEYVTFKHVKTRKVVVLEVEVPEELFQDVIAKLGMPIGGESKPVAVCLLNCDNKNHNVTEEITPVVKESLTTEKSEGDKLRERACILCKERHFQIFCEYLDKDIIVANEDAARDFMLVYCKIKSRKELVTDTAAQLRFDNLIFNYMEWLKPSIDEQYPDNLSQF